MSEVVIYHLYSQSGNSSPAVSYAKKPVSVNFLEGLRVIEAAPKTSVSENTIGSRLSAVLNKIALTLAAIGIVMILVAYAPEISGLAKSLGTTVANYRLTSQEVSTLSEVKEEKPAYQPAYDPKLPKQNKIMISSIGVNSDIQEATYDNYEEALKKGIWRVSDFGSPKNGKMPTILAAHRYGYLAWTWNFRKTSSFFNLPKIKVGDTVTVIWEQRKYIYEVYAEGKGDGITDYSADLILYTCESLTGDVRIFKYARLLEV